MQDDDQEEEFILYSAPLIDSPGSEATARSEAESQEQASPDSPAQRSILPNSAPGFSISPFPLLMDSALHPSHVSSGGHVTWGDGMTAVSHAAAQVEAEHEAVPAVDDVNELNMLLK